MRPIGILLCRLNYEQYFLGVGAMNKEIIKRIIELQKENKKIRDIAFEVGLSPDYVYKIIRNIDYYKRKYLRKDEDNLQENTSEIYNEGKKLIFELQDTEYNLYMNLKKYMRKNLDLEPSDRYIFLKMLYHFYDFYVNNEKNREKN